MTRLLRRRHRQTRGRQGALRPICAIAAWLLLTTLPANAFLRITVRDPDTRQAVPVVWREVDFPIPYTVQRDGPSQLAEGSHVTAIQEAFRTWADAGGGGVRFTFVGRTDFPAAAMDGSNTVLFSTDRRNFLGPLTVGTTMFFVLFPSLTERAARLIEADIILNAAEPFTTETPTPAFLRDLQAVVTHEVGHLLGFDHSPVDGPAGSEQRATMFPFNRRGQAEERSLAPDDLAGLATVYAASGQAMELGSIEGTVTNLVGRSFFGALVLAHNVDVPDQGAIGTLSGLRLTDSPESGAYRLEGLRPGHYLIEVRGVSDGVTAASFLGVQFQHSLAPVPVSWFFESSANPASALPLEIRPGTSLRGIDVRLGGRSTAVPPNIYLEPQGFLLSAPNAARLEITTPLGNTAAELGLFRFLVDGQALVQGVQALAGGHRLLRITRRSSNFLHAEVELPPLAPGRHELGVEVADRRGARRTTRNTVLVADAPPRDQMVFEARYIAEDDERVDLLLPPAYPLHITVRDRNGSPAPGVVLRLIPFRNAAEELRPRSDAEGALDVLLPPQTYRLALAQPTPVGLLDAAQPDEITITGPTTLELRLTEALPPAPQPTAPEPILVAGSVRDIRGNFLTGALVQLFTVGSGAMVAQGAVNAQGRFQIVVPPARYDVTIAPPVEHAVTTQPVEQRLPDRPLFENTELRVVLPNGFIFGGQIVDSAGLPLPFANLRVDDHFSGDGLFALAADLNGKFSILLAAGVYDFEFDPGFNHDRFSRAVPHRLERYIHDAPSDLRVVLPDGIVVSGRIEDARGDLAPFARITIRRPPTGSAIGTARADQHGEFSFSLSPGRYILQFDPARLPAEPNRAARTVLPPTTYETDARLVVVLQDGLTFGGTVRDINGAGVSAARISVRGIIENTPLALTTTSANDGSFHLLVPRGAYRLTVSPP